MSSVFPVLGFWWLLTWYFCSVLSNHCAEIYRLHIAHDWIQLVLHEHRIIKCMKFMRHSRFISHTAHRVGRNSQFVQYIYLAYTLIILLFWCCWIAKVASSAFSSAKRIGCKKQLPFEICRIGNVMSRDWILFILVRVTAFMSRHRQSRSLCWKYFANKYQLKETILHDTNLGMNTGNQKTSFNRKSIEKQSARFCQVKTCNIWCDESTCVQVTFIKLLVLCYTICFQSILQIWVCHFRKMDIWKRVATTRERVSHS